MQAKTSDKAQKIVVLGTGGTIAGLSTPEKGAGAYVAGQKPIEELLAGLAAPAALADIQIQSEQVAQIDSKDMSLSVWQALLRRCRHWLTQADVRGVLITHGTDTLEETAWWLQILLGSVLRETGKPLVLTCAMRPADAPDADGPGNLRDALAVLADPQACGERACVLAVCAGRVMGARDVRKAHASRLDAFDSGEAGDLGQISHGLVRWLREPVLGEPPSPTLLDTVLATSMLPRVEIVMSHAAVSEALVDALCDAELARRLGTPRVRGLIVAATGNGTLHHTLETALRRAKAQGVRVLRVTRCADGGLQARASDEFVASTLNPVKARIALALALMGEDMTGTDTTGTQGSSML